MAVLWTITIVIAMAGVSAFKARESFQPVDVGFQFSTPVNLANTLQNSVAGPLSLVLVVAFTGILVAGLIVPKLTSAWSARSSDDDFNSSWWRRILDPLDIEEAFEFMDDLRDPCRRKILCHVHSFVPYAPTWLQTVFRLISRNIRGVARYKEDIIQGLGGADCHQVYQAECPQTVGQLLTMTRPIRRILQQQGRHFHSTGDRYFNFV
ncbi:Uncharacterized protein APZ42_019036 [Daphnia magna]|uniref:Uncharacterized protein n=1 Tax=Daphnia magna TaxID=35525 RepID=A0A0N7ZK54_9CRUS|nr:Uncharacterized protein APZ42_019036 [Daphnia magna]